MPTPYTMKFIIMVWLAFLTRVKPVSTIANPACMNMTRNPVTSVQTKLMAILFCPTWLAMSPMVSPFALGVLSVMGSAIGMSETLPVMLPSRPPLPRTLASGEGIPLRSASVMGTGAAAGAAGGGAAGGCECPKGARPKTKVSPSSRGVLFIDSFPPDCLAQVGAVEHADDSAQAYSDAHQHYDH